MADHMIIVSLTFPPELLTAIDEWRRKQQVVPNRSKTVVYLLQKALKEM